jgi:type IV secretion system protein VirB10
MASITIGASCSRPRLSTLLSVGAEAGSSGQESDIVRALRNGASNSISQTGQQIVQRQLNIAPTLTIRPGFPSA